MAGASRGRRGTISHPQAFCVAGVALMAVGGALGSGLGAPWSRVTLRHFCVAGVAQTHIHHCFRVAGVAQTHIHLRFAWQAWHKLTSTFASRGRRGTISHPQAFCVAGVALMAVGGALGSGLGAPWSRVTPRHFAWQAWHKLTSTLVSRGSVAQTHSHLRFAWQAWHSWQWVACLGLVWARPGRA